MLIIDSGEWKLWRYRLLLGPLSVRDLEIQLAINIERSDINNYNGKVGCKERPAGEIKKN